MRISALCSVVVAGLVLWVAAPASAALVAYYNFNDSTNPAAAPDSSGNGNHGTIVGATYSVDTPAGVGGAGSMDFPGGGNAVDLPAAGFASLTANNAATVVFWLKAPAQNQTNIHFGTAVDGANRQFSAHTPWSDGNVYFDTGGCCADPSQRTSFFDGGDASNWHHWAFVKNGNSKFVYKDGNLVDTELGATSPIGAINVAAIGNWNSNSNDPVGVVGKMDEVAIYNEGLSEAQIDNIIANGVPEPASLSLLALGGLGLLARRRSM